MLITEYTPTWITDFEAIKLAIETVLPEIEYSIEHVGSTSVPHLAAKPIIDLDIIYQQPADFELIKSALEKLGYTHHGNQGIEDRDVFKRNATCSHAVLDTVKQHLYVCPIHSKALERHILSRDYLRKHEWARLEYQQIKYRLAEEANQDKKVYAALKELHANPFIDSIIEKEKNDRITSVS
ncbi:MAG: GrpB family protein [Chitinophagaceae bacterium]|jgi:GrpB-like predicted nucleotidyltransferase (UPF0157 family)|nr:GrpB family protein [Chitinophagaceae bacterium]